MKDVYPLENTRGLVLPLQCVLLCKARQPVSIQISSNKHTRRDFSCILQKFVSSSAFIFFFVKRQMFSKQEPAEIHPVFQHTAPRSYCETGTDGSCVRICPYISDTVRVLMHTVFGLTFECCYSTMHTYTTNQNSTVQTV